MRVAIVGSRTIKTPALLREAIQASGWAITAVVSGGASGVDTLAEHYARRQQCLPYTVYPANWRLHGKQAGLLRNQQILADCEAVLAVWDGESRGTSSTIALAKAYNKPLYVHVPQRQEGERDVL